MMSKKLFYLSHIIVFSLILTCTANAADLVGWWTFDGDTLDSSGLNNEATLAGDPEYVEGWLGQAVFLDGDDYITMDGVADNIQGNDITMNAWVKTADTGDWFSINSSTGGNVALLATDNQRLAMYDNGYEGHSTTIVTDGQWHMLTYVRRGSTGYIYVDGVQENSHQADFSLSADDRWSLGQEWDGEVPSDFLTGTIDEVRVYKGGLTDEEVIGLFNSSTTSATAWRPQPANGQTEVMTNEDLTWAPGLDAVSRNVYIGINEADVAAGTGGTSQGNQTALSYDPGTLLPGVTYYWRIDEEASDGTSMPGDIWSFTTVEFVIVDDFEDYNDYPPDRIYDIWKDGWDDPSNGSQAGYTDPSFTEQTIVKSGVQSMPFFYDNGASSYSEVVHTFDTSQDYTLNGLMGLTLWFQGRPASVGSLSFDAATQTYIMTGSGADIGGTSDEFHFAYKTLNGPGSIVAKVESLSDTHSWAEAGVMIRNTLEADSIHAMVAVTPSGRVAFQFRSTVAQDSHSTHTGTGVITGPHWIKLTRSASNVFTAEHSTDGVNWSLVQSNDPADPSSWSMPMGQSVYAGLVVSAHNAKATCEATFSNVTAGSPGPFVESQDIGISSNSPGPLYLRLQDTSGISGTVFHENGREAVFADDWQLWAIPLEEFQTAGVDLTAIKEIAIGVGDKDNPQSGGLGRLLIDDIRLVRHIPTTGRILLFEEDFESLVLGPNVDEALAGGEVWTKIPPDGWAIDDSGVPGAGDAANDGVTEWAGWSFANKTWWAETAGDQDRSQFVLANGTIAVVDPDEWDDMARAEGLMNSFLITPEIDVSAIKAGAGTLQLKFDSSWRPEDTQTANVTVQFDGGDPIEVMRWESQPGASFKPDATSETVTVNIGRPSGAKKMVVTFGMLDAGNDWWWAIDNVQVSGNPRERIVVLAEDFEGLELGPNVDESSGDEVWTDTPPEGWIIDESGVPGIGNPATDGVTEWAGWAFTNKDWWIGVAGNQRRVEFELGQGTVAVADPDEWDDADHADSAASGWYKTFLSTPSLDIAGFEAGSVQIKFDSSWRPEFDSDYHQTGNLTASFDGAEPIELFRWESDPSSANFKPDTSTNETIIVDLEVPTGVTSVVLTFGLYDAGNDWWWAIDNLEVSGLPRERVIALYEDFEGLELGPNVDESSGDEVWTDTPPEGWIIDESGVPGIGDPATDGVTEWAGWAFTNKDWWIGVAGNQRRVEFELGQGTVAVADPDEWDDADHADSAASGWYKTFLSTPAIDISGFEAGTLQLKFDSSWRPEFDDNYHQTAIVTASFDGADSFRLLLWESDGSSPNFKPDATNETVIVDLENPDGATSLVLEFGLFDAGNDWWWAIDNVEVIGNIAE
ncbi:MAG: LamG domain-containing protein [Planctomycetes bacterium]|nr:LamG domain-containing protein [Planctomycetota bacterium]MBL7143874.1 LamG domain-containing protein [Phycisphaerae bacterium]